MTQALFRDDAYRTETEATVASSDARGVALDRTVFYPQGGGQSGDRGTLIIEGGPPIAVVNTVYDADRATILHVPADGAALPPPGARVIARIDWEPALQAHARPYRAPSALGRPALPGDRRIGRRRRGAARFRFGRGGARQGRGRAPAQRTDRARRGGEPALDRRRGARGQPGPDQDHVGQAADGNRAVSA